MAGTGILLLNLGGPDSLEAVGPFLYNLFSDREIIALPGGPALQPLLARVIARARGPSVRRNYAGIGGKSPILDLTRRQAAALEAALNAGGAAASSRIGPDRGVAAGRDMPQGPFTVRIAMRYWKPDTADALRELFGAGITRIVALTLYPHFSAATTGSSLNELQRALDRPELTAVLDRPEPALDLPAPQQVLDRPEPQNALGGPDEARLPARGRVVSPSPLPQAPAAPARLLRAPAGITVTAIDRYPTHPGYLEAIAATVEEALRGLPEESRQRACLLFSAHGLPMKFIRAGDPYVREIAQTRDGVLEILRARGWGNPWKLGYQSRTGPVKWIGPYTDRVIEELAEEGVRDIIVVPIAFVSDHIETLYEIDQLFAELARRRGIRHFIRTRMLNDDPVFIQALAGMVRNHLSDGGMGAGAPSQAAGDQAGHHHGSGLARPTPVR